MKWLLAVSVVLGTATAASAQSAGAQAEVLFREGRDLMAKGKYPEACASFEKSQQLDPAISTLLNLAGCREKNGQIATAWGLFLDAERQTRSATDAGGSKMHDVAKTRAANLEATVSKLTINVAHAVTGLEITRGTEKIESVMWNRALPIDGGTYTITAKAPGAKDWSTQVTVGNAKDAKTVEVPDLQAPVVVEPPKVTPVKQPEPEHPLPPPTDSPRHGSMVLPITVGVGGLALIGAAVAFELSARSTYDDAKAEVTDQAKRDSLESSANNKRYLSEGLAVGGVAAVGVAVWLFVRNKDQDKTEVASHRVVVSPTGIALVGSF